MARLRRLAPHLFLSLSLGWGAASPPPARAQDEGDEEAYADEEDGSASDGEGEDEAELGLEGEGDEDAVHEDVGFELHLGFNWYLGAGAGLRLDFPVVSDGLLDGTDDDLRISLGADVHWFFGDRDGIGVFPVLCFQWGFYLGEDWSIAPELGAALLFVPEREGIFASFIAPHAGLVGRYHMNARNALLLRVAWPGGIQLGLVF